MNVLMYYECLTGGPVRPQKRFLKPPWGTVGPSVGALGRLLAAHMAFLGRLWRFLSDLGAIAVDLGANLVDLGANLVDLGSNLVDLGSNLVDLRLNLVPLGGRSSCFCDALSLKWVESLAEEPNLISTRYGRVQMRFDAFAHD